MPRLGLFVRHGKEDERDRITSGQKMQRPYRAHLCRRHHPPFFFPSPAPLIYRQKPVQSLGLINDLFPPFEQSQTIQKNGRPISGRRCLIHSSRAQDGFTHRSFGGERFLAAIILLSLTAPQRHSNNNREKGSPLLLHIFQLCPYLQNVFITQISIWNMPACVNICAQIQ